LCEISEQKMTEEILLCESQKSRNFLHFDPHLSGYSDIDSAASRSFNKPGHDASYVGLNCFKNQQAPVLGTALRDRFVNVIEFILGEE